MRKLSIIHFLGLALLAMTFNACVEDPNDPGTGTGGGGMITNAPELNLVDEAGFVAFDTEIGAGDAFTVRLDATKGDSPLNVVYVTEDGLNLTTDRFSVNGTNAAANPLLLFAGDKDGFIWDITVQGHEVGTREYAFIIEDEAGETSTQRISITADEGTPPIIEIGGSQMYMADPGSFIIVPLIVGQGTFLISSITVEENGVVIDDFMDRLRYDDLSFPFTGNPFSVPADDQIGLDKDIYVRAPQDPGTYEYTVTVADELGNVSVGTFSITVEEQGTPVNTLQGVLFNRAGPAGTGGLDLDTGVGTGSADPDAEIRDEGIDTSVGNDVNWIKRIKGVNGTELKLLVPQFGGVPEGFSYDGVTTVEQLAALDGLGTEFTEVNSNGEIVSYLVEVGDIFFAKGTSRNYLLIVREVNETPDNNNDNYVLDIKY